MAGLREASASRLQTPDLEEFLFANWSSIPWPSDLTLYTTDESNGRQFPAGSWSIDFLAIDRSTNDLVVIELTH